MPRKSESARAAAIYRAKGKAPAPPAHLDAESKKIWRRITHSKAVDYFEPGSEPLLEAYVRSLVMHRFYSSIWENDPHNRDEVVKNIVALNNSLAQLGTKLRLAITSVDRRSGILDEKGLYPEKMGKSGDLLFGGDGTNVIRF